MEQLTLDDAMRQGEQAMNACADKADRVNPPGWTDLGFAWVVKWATARAASEHRSIPFTAEEMVNALVEDPQFLQPHDERAFGAVVKRAINRGAIDYFDSKGRRLKGHGSRCDRYLVTGKRPTEIFRGES